MALLKQRTPDRIHFKEPVYAGPYTQFPKGAILELADGKWPAQVEEWIASGRVERVTGDVPVPLGVAVVTVGPANFAQWFRELTPPPVDPDLDQAELRRRFGWTDAQVETALEHCGLPQPTMLQVASLRGVTRHRSWRWSAIERWREAVRSLRM